MGGPEGIDVENLRTAPELMERVFEQQSKKSKREGWRRKYTSVPREWEVGLLSAKRISTYRLALEILYLYWYGKGKQVTVSGKVAKAVGLSARSKWAALAELERLGLIKVDRNQRRSPRVIPFHTQAPKS
jgi:hypothetical protein